MTAGNLLALALSQRLVKEMPAGSNCVKYNTEYYGREVRDTSTASYPWCCVFIWWLFRQSGAPELFYGGGKTASCGALASYAKTHGLWIDGDYRPGDLVFLKFSGTVIQHIGVVVENRGAAGLLTIEGNTGMEDDTNGGQVQQRVRALRYAVGGYRPAYGADAAGEEDENVGTYPYLADVPAKFRPIIDKLMTAGIIQGDGSDAAHNGDVINLTHEQVRTLVLVYRGGGFDRKLMAAGLAPAVP